MGSRVLLTGSSATATESFDDNSLSTFDQDTSYIPGALDSEVLDRIADGEFDGVVCQADGAEALDLVSRIRVRNPRVPIVLVSSRPDADFEVRACANGASSVLGGNLHAAIVAENVVRVMRLKLATVGLEVRARECDRLRRELLTTVLDRKAILQQGGHINRHWMKRGLLPLLVENDPAEAFQMVKAFDQAGVYAPLPIMKSADEALQYLDGAAPFESRDLNPLPNAILLDLDRPELGVSLCGWIRAQPPLASIPIIVLSGVALPKATIESFGNRANSFLVKSGNQDELVTLIRSIDLYWTRMNVGRAY